MYGPVVMKSVLRLESPLQWIGGLLHELYKGSGVMAHMPSWRAIMCSNAGGKRLHSLVRPRVFEFASGWLSDSQCGGWPTPVLVGTQVSHFNAYRQHVV